MYFKAAKFLSSGLVSFFVALMLASPVIYWAFDRSPPVIVHGFELFPKEVRAGETLNRRVTVTRQKSCTTSVDIFIIDGAKVRWFFDEPEIANPGPTGVQESYVVPLRIPLGAAPGDAEFRITTFRQCNPLHAFFPLISRREPIKFRILPPEGH